MSYLEDWGTIENEHCFSLSGTIRALKASTLWIPQNNFPHSFQVDIKAMKNAINSAVDAMQAMGSSICHLSSKVKLCKISFFSLGCVLFEGIWRGEQMHFSIDNSLSNPIHQ